MIIPIIITIASILFFSFLYLLIVIVSKETKSRRKNIQDTELIREIREIANSKLKVGKFNNSDIKNWPETVKKNLMKHITF